MRLNNYVDLNFKAPLYGMLLSAALGTSIGVQAQPEDPSICKVGVIVDVLCVDESSTVIFLAFEGIAPYTFYMNGVQVTGEISNVPDGYYEYLIVDQLGCTVEGDFTVACGGDCGYSTYTMGGWSSTPAGNNPGTYLDANFATSFPGGLTIGCDRILRLTSAQAVRNFLPSGTTARKLTSPLVQDPGQSYRNVLAGQLVAATLNVTFDANDPDFGTTEGWLGDLVIAYGPFEGWTVSELIEQANLFIGNCGGSYTASQFNEALSLLNESFVDGVVANDFLICGAPFDPKAMPTAAATGLELHLYPVPAQDLLNVSVPDGADLDGLVRILDLSGRVVADKGRMQMFGGAVNTLDVSHLQEGVYLLSIELDRQRFVKAFSVVR